MEKTFRDRYSDFFHEEKDPPLLTEEHTIRQAIELQPKTLEFIERRYGVKIEAEDQRLSLKEFSEKHQLLPASQLLADIQTVLSGNSIRRLCAKEAMEYLKCQPEIRTLDVRENHQTLGIPNAQYLDAKLLDDILGHWPKESPILVYCESGKRGMDAAQFLQDRGFAQVYFLEGGLEAWAKEFAPASH